MSAERQTYKTIFSKRAGETETEFLKRAAKDPEVNGIVQPSSLNAKAVKSAGNKTEKYVTILQ